MTLHDDIRDVVGHKCVHSTTLTDRANLEYARRLSKYRRRDQAG